MSGIVSQHHVLLAYTMISTAVRLRPHARVFDIDYPSMCAKLLPLLGHPQQEGTHAVTCATYDGID